MGGLIITTLLVGFDSAWTASNSGAIIGVLCRADGGYEELGPPSVVDYPAGEATILAWQSTLLPDATLIALDQPTIVKNAVGQRPVENLVSSPVSRRYGGVQPASIAKVDMFGPAAPIWGFLQQFGGAANPLDLKASVQVIETYPVLAIIAQGWLLPDRRPAMRLPKYNPERSSRFSIADWQFLCGRVAHEYRRLAFAATAQWIEDAARNPFPSKQDQDGLDACICLLVSLSFASGRACLMVGNMDSGYIIVPDSASLHAELTSRCETTGRTPQDWLRVIRRPLTTWA